MKKFVLKEKTCCFTAPRQLSDKQKAYTESKLTEEVFRAVSDGYTYFISGFDTDAELTFAAIVAELKKELPHLHLKAFRSYVSTASQNCASTQTLLAACDEIEITAETYSSTCTLLRNQRMVREFDRVIAVYDGQETGSTAFTMRYARVQNKELRIIHT